MGFFGGSAAGWADAYDLADALALAGFEVGCQLRAVAADDPAVMTLRVFGPELDGAEMFVRPARFDGAAVFVSGSLFPWGGDGELATESAATDACTFDADAGPAWTPPDCCCTYHQPPPVSSRTPAAIAPIKMPLFELLGPLFFSSSNGSALPNVGSCSSGMLCSSTAVTVSGAIFSTLGCSARRFDFSLSTNSSFDEGASEFRARGSSHAGTCSSSSRSSDFAGSGSSFTA